MFDSVISFAGKTSATKKVPPPVAPKPNKKVHVSSYTMQIKSKGPVQPASSAPAPAPAKPTPPKDTPPASRPPAKEIPVRVTPIAAPSMASSVVIPPPSPVAPTTPKVQSPVKEPPSPVVKQTSPPPTPEEPKASPAPSDDTVPSGDEKLSNKAAYGPGLESLEVNCIGNFQVSCPHTVREEDLEIVATGPSGTKPVTVEPLGNGQFSCSYQPTMAGDHIVSVKVDGEHVPGSPFKAQIKFAAYTDKCAAAGPGLVAGTTDSPCHFNIRSKEDAGYARLSIHIVGPSKAEPVLMVENPQDNSVDVTYHPTAPGDYTIRLLWGEAHVRGSPFVVPVTGTGRNDPSKVKVSGPGLSGGKVGEQLKVFIEGEAGAGPGPLGIKVVGPSKPEITADAESREEGVEVTITCQDPGDYQLILQWGKEDVPSSPYTIKVTGEGRKVRPELCTASGEGVSKGEVGKKALFSVHIPDDAGPGALGVAVAGPHPPKPIEITNHQDGHMSVSYLPIAPGEYKIDVTWGDQHITGSPFTATVVGKAIRNAKLVEACGQATKEPIKCNQLATIVVTPKEGAGAGPMRAKLEGPSKADLQLSSNQDGTMLVSFLAKNVGTYKLYLLWGEGEDSDICGSPFTIKVI